MENMQVTSPLPKEKSFFNVMTQVIKMTPDAKAKAKAKEKPPSSESGLSPDQVLSYLSERKTDIDRRK